MHPSWLGRVQWVVLVAHKSAKRGCAAQDGRVMTVGDTVELCLMPGDQAPRVARLQALWSQAAIDGREHMLAQCTLFYRPSVRLRAACLQALEPQMAGHWSTLALLAHGACRLLPGERAQHFIACSPL